MVDARLLGIQPTQDVYQTDWDDFLSMCDVGSYVGDKSGRSELAMCPTWTGVADYTRVYHCDFNTCLKWVVEQNYEKGIGLKIQQIISDFFPFTYFCISKRLQIKLFFWKPCFKGWYKFF